MGVPKFSRDSILRRCEGNTGEVVEQEKTLCNKEETVKWFAYESDNLTARG